MLKKISLIFSVTALAATLAVGDFFLMRELPRALAFIIHNALASLIGICFVVAALGVKKKDNGWDYRALFLLSVGAAMLAIHLVKIFLSKC